MPERTERLRGRAAVTQRVRRMERTHWLCEICAANGRNEVAVVVDHVLALANGGDDTDANTQNLCRPCHDRKTAEDFGHNHKPKPIIGNDGWPKETP